MVRMSWSEWKRSRRWRSCRVCETSFKTGSESRKR